MVACALLLVPAAVALAAVNGTFKGKTSQGRSVKIKVVNGVVLGASSSILYKAKCTGNSTLKDGTSLTGPLHKGNSFSVVNAHYTDSVGTGIKAKHSATVHFTISGHKAQGTFSDNSTIVQGTKVLAHCATGKVTFTATS